MALIFSLYAVCRDEGGVEPFLAHFRDLRWTLADGTETTLEAGPYRLAMPGAIERACWITPTGISTYGIRDDRDAALMTELGNRLCEHLRTAPPFELASVGIEVDQQLDDAEVDEMIREDWSGLIFTDEIWRRAGSRPSCLPFRDGMWWHPYIGEWERASLRHLPDIAAVTCLGCDELIRDHQLVRLEEHGHSTCCVWHPYHLWCIREAPPHAAPITDCAHCGAAFELPQLRDTIRWGAATPHHLHVRSIAVDPPFAIRERGDVYANKPPGISRIALRSLTREVARRSGHELHEYVHDACPTEDPWLLRLRAAPGDAELRNVYADHLEQSGDLERAELVRALLVIPPIVRARPHAEALYARLVTQSRAWLRDVCR